jgi:ATP-dependent Clp protease ATP-binding subunit ClpC
MKARVMDQIERVFRPEFLNRLDDTIIFRHLNKEDLEKGHRFRIVESA